MRISGMASGFDIDAMVKQLMESHSAPLNKLKQKTLSINYQQEAFRSVSTMLVDFRNNKLPNLALTSSINAKKAEVTGNTAAISAKANAKASNSILNVEVQELATASTLKFKVNNPDNKDLATATLADLGWTNATGKLKIGTTDINYASTDTLESLVKKINSNKDANVTALYNSNGEISITSKTTGKVNIKLDGDFTVSGNIIYNSLTDYKEGLNGKAIVNGITMETANNKLEVNGVEIVLKQQSLGNGISTIGVTTDSSKILDNIKSFIADYNKVLETMNGKLGEARYRGYDPLTDEQRQELTDKQAEMWDEKARSGLLRNDSILSQTVSSLRTAIISNFGDINNKFNIQSIGITTGKWHEGGKLVIEDEQKLLNAIEADPEKVMQLFTARSDNPPAAGFNQANNPESGIFTRISSILMESLKSMSNKAGTSQVSTSLTDTFLVNSLLSTQKREVEDKITSLNRRLTALETQYFKQFTAMESAINRYNSQASSLFSFANG
ncbi:hypothetical protein PAT3040_01746 [Paenibacillus agaridevorans]|uniref:Flagellar hook-associated protein 2 n=1 Tax=Paenibacillus agaridevorans TaxID=171404 RepID=A0A2R5EQB7_9BACL|nr:flagellar filament capping protein FliD [Paenibacillus agaridevorans]GBG07198.1 hypothetical protein PAT3040_01746 [Paenibacillus agaridevorans]